MLGVIGAPLTKIIGVHRLSDGSYWRRNQTRASPAGGGASCAACAHASGITACVSHGVTAVPSIARQAASNRLRPAFIMLVSFSQACGGNCREGGRSRQFK